MSTPTLRQLLDLATPGPWDSPQAKPIIFQNEEGQNFSGGDWMVYPPLGESGPVAIAGCEANAQLIARCSPATLRAVLHVLEKYHEAMPTPESTRSLALLNGEDLP